MAHQKTNTLTLAEILYERIGSTSAGIRSSGLRAGDRQKIIEQLENSMLRKEPIPFVIRWAKGPYDQFDESCNIESIQFLAQSLRRISDSYIPGISLEVVFTDTHERLNNNEPSKEFLTDLRRGFQEHFHNTDYGLNFKKLSMLSERLAPHGFVDPTKTAEGRNSLREKAFNSSITNKELNKLSARASTYGSRTKEDEKLLATMYHELCSSEVTPMNDAFAGTIYLTCNPAKKSAISLPKDVPVFSIFSMYNLREGLEGEANKDIYEKWGVTDKPWNKAASAQQRCVSEQNISPLKQSISDHIIDIHQAINKGGKYTDKFSAKKQPKIENLGKIGSSSLKELKKLQKTDPIFKLIEKSPRRGRFANNSEMIKSKPTKKLIDRIADATAAGVARGPLTPFGR